jgi:membrane-associated phospholipid phosphatase
MRGGSAGFRIVVFLFAMLNPGSPGWAQSTPTEKPNSGAVASPSKPERSYELEPGEDPENRLLSHFVKHIVRDQEQFWTAPTRLRIKDLQWIVPSAAATAGLILGDSWISRQVSNTPSQLNRSLHISDYTTYAMIGAGGGAFLLGSVTHNDHLEESGLLAGEAAINSTAVTYLFKEITQRQRPMEGNGNGNFFHGGASFPSEHSAIAWSLASVFAHEYPGTLTQMAAYGAASAVTLTRVTARQHFPSDVLIGSALGWYFGRQVYRAHHDKELGGTSWGSFLPDKSEKVRNSANLGSPYVPIDSWVYPALDRLIALGYVKSSVVGMRPWTRLECARLLEEASDTFQSGNEAEPSAQKLYDAVSSYFSPEIHRLDGESNVGASVDSVYTRATGISGQPLRDGFHVAQTLVNDYGRPYAEGFNDVTGIDGHAEAGPLYLSIQGEYQSAPSSPSYSSNALAVLASLDEVPSVSNATSAVSRFRLLDSSIGVTFHNFQISFGKESLWLGPGVGGPFLFSNNAEPIPMVRFDQVAPVYVPGLSRILGPMRAEFALGRMDGAQWINSNGTVYGPQISDQPFVHIDKVGFKPTENLEFGMGISSVFGGAGSPVTLGNFFLTYSPRCAVSTCSIVLYNRDYGDRRSTADFSYRIPHLRDWLTLYADAFVEDEISPIGSSRPALRDGIYMPKLPKLPKLYLRVESVYTDAPNTVFIGNYYDNGRYRSGYTNYDQIMGSWIGRAGKGGQAWATYWVSPRTSLQLQYRREVVSREFLPGGGGLHDFGLKGDLQLRSDLHLQGFVQYEMWNFPVLAPQAKTDVAASVQLTFYPKWSLKR